MVSETIVDIIKWAHSIPQCTSITSVQPNGKLLEDTSALWASNEFQCLARRCRPQHFCCTLLSEITHSFSFTLSKDCISGVIQGIVNECIWCDFRNSPCFFWPFYLPKNIFFRLKHTFSQQATQFEVSFMLVAQTWRVKCRISIVSMQV